METKFRMGLLFFLIKKTLDKVIEKSSFVCYNNNLFKQQHVGQ